PNTSPNKTLGGHLGALALTTPLMAFLGHHVYKGTPLDHVGWLLLLGALISVAGQLADLMLSSVKRDIRIKDMSVTIPRHGVELDAYNYVPNAEDGEFQFGNFLIDMAMAHDARIVYRYYGGRYDVTCTSGAAILGRCLTHTASAGFRTDAYNSVENAFVG